METLNNWGGETQTDQDMAKKFSGSYILARYKDGNNIETTSVIYIAGFDNGHAVFSHFSLNGKVNYAQLRDQVEVVKALPDVGVYSMTPEGGVILVRRWPARQWHEGLCRGNTHLMFNGENTISGHIPWETAAHLFAPQIDIPLEQGLEKVKPGHTLRLNNRMWLKSPAEKRATLYSMDKRIGSWEFGEFFWARAASHSARICEEDMRERLGVYAAL